MGNLKKYKLIDIYLLVALINVIAVLCALFVTNGDFLSEIVWDARNPLFIDFEQCQGTHIGLAGFAIFAFIGRFIPDGLIDDSTVDEWPVLFCVILIVLCSVIIHSIIAESLGENLTRTLLFSLIFFSSQPFAFACVKAGNTVFLSLTFLIMAFYLRNKDNAVARECALILIAMAADLKLAPAIFGLLYLKEKRFAETIRLAVYGVVCILVPHMIAGGLSVFLERLTRHGGAATPRPETIIGVVTELYDLMGKPLEAGAGMGYILAIVYLLIVVLLFFICRKSWKTVFLLTSILIVFLNLSYPYTLCYLILPLLEFIKEDNSNVNVSNIICAALFALVFTVYPVLRIDWPTATFITNYFVLYVFLFYIICSLIISVIKDRKAVRSNRLING